MIFKVGVHLTEKSVFFCKLSSSLGGNSFVLTASQNTFSGDTNNHAFIAFCFVGNDSGICQAQIVYIATDTKNKHAFAEIQLLKKSAKEVRNYGRRRNSTINSRLIH
jgi:hypothetical protein